MPIPAAKAHDVVLAYLFTRQGTKMDCQLPMSDVLKPLVAFFTHRGAPGFVPNGHFDNGVPVPLMQALRGLQRRRFIEYNLDEDWVRVTGLGAYVALLHDLPEELHPNSV